ncbi:MAG: NADPH:quinone oxidoreductase [Leptospiraceae bacterium]|nr:MAG: NADPH:quinone oxidoreductase [Leptospiraceae bacterium]
MKNVKWIFDQFGFENLKIVESDIPEIQDDEILLEMKAASLNFRDLLMIKGNYNPKLRMPIVPCSDGVGIVIKKGKKVHHLQEGDRVIPIFAQGWYDGPPFRSMFRKTLGGPLDGTLQKYMIVPANDVVKSPEHLTDEEAATLPCAGLTAWSALVELGRVKPAEKVLALGTGGVSIFALQFAKMMGAETIITSSSEEKLNRAKQLGADYGINYKTNPDWEKEVLKISQMMGVDHIIEVGGVGTLEKSIKSVKPGGNIYLIGVLAGKQAPVDLTPVLMQNIKIQGVVVGHKRALEEMIRAISYFKLKPVVDKVFLFEQAKDAFEYMHKGSHFGKVCIKI